MAEKQTKSKKEPKKRLSAKADTGLSRTQENENNVLDLLGSRALDQKRGDLLTNPYLSPIQRQEALRNIGQTSGNQHLHQLITQLSNSDQQADSIQRQDGHTETRGGQTYEVVAGDSLWRIAKNTYGHGRYWREIYNANPGKAARGGNLILIGTLLTLPVLQVPAAAPAVPEPANGGTEPAVGPVGISTEFGNFDIYPDDFIGPLPVSVRSAESWPIRQADFDNLVTRLTEVSNNASKLIITGTDAFKTGVMLDLGWLMTSSVGQDLVREIQESAHTVTIKQGAGGNATSYSPDADSYERPISPPEAGPGANVTISYNPSILFIKDGSLAWHHRPPAIGLAHEMVHAWTGVYGTRALYETAGIKRRELQATGLDEFATARLSENRFRAAFGLPERPVY